MRIYLIFYISLLESADPETLIFITIIKNLTQKNEYEIERIIDYNYKIRRYTVKWKRHLPKKNL